MENKVVLITGASRGIGRAAGNLMTNAGYRVFGTSRTPETVGDLGFTLLQLDVCDDESVAACVAAVIQQAGRVDILINNAGFSLSGALEEASIAEAQALFDANFFGVLRMINAVLPHMRAQGGGQIINISSIAGVLGVPYLGLYTATKYAIEGYSETLRHEVRRFGISVALIQPGDIRTDIYTQTPAQTIPDYNGVRERINAIHTANVQNGPGPEVVARKILQVAGQRWPRLRHAVGKEAWVPLAKRLLPEQIAEPIMRLTYQVDDK